MGQPPSPSPEKVTRTPVHTDRELTSHGMKIDEDFSDNDSGVEQNQEIKQHL